MIKQVIFVNFQVLLLLFKPYSKFNNFAKLGDDL